MKITKLTISKIEQCPIAKSSMTTYLRHRFPRLYKQILKQTSFLDKFADDKRPISLYERLHCIKNCLHDRPKCQMCRENYVSRFIGEKDCYSKWCSPSCQASDPVCIKKGKTTKKEKYGDENFNNVEKRRATIYMLTENDAQYWENRTKKTKATKLKNHGSENFNNAKKISETIHQHEAKDCEYWIKREKKTKATKVKNGHDPNWNNREKARQTCFDNYGVEWFFQSDEWKSMHNEMLEHTPDFYTKQIEKRMNTIESISDFYEKRSKKTAATCIDRYGVKSAFQLESCRQKRIDAEMNKKMMFLAECQYDEPLFNVDELKKNYKNKNHKYKFKCKKCGKKFLSTLKWSYAEHHHCTKCFPRSRARCEMQMLEYVTSIWKNHDEVIYNDRTQIAPYELDVAVVSESKIAAFEYTGLYWHSYDLDKSNKRRHVDKLEKCTANGIQLVTVFEDEWLFDPDSAKSKISKVLGVSKHVKAEDCDIMVEEQKISLVERQTNNNLMSVRFSHSRLNIKEEWEIADIHEALFITVDGGLERIISEFEKLFNPKSVVVFVDRRWNNGSEYEVCGFKTVKKLKPQCWWFDIHDIHRHHEREFVEKIASEMLNEKFTHSRKQMDELKQLGWMRIFDCGKLKMVKTFSA